MAGSDGRYLPGLRVSRRHTAPPVSMIVFLGAAIKSKVIPFERFHQFETGRKALRDGA